MAARARSGPGGYLGDYRLRIALVVAAVEGFLVVVGVLPNWAVFVLAGIAVGFWLVAGRTYRSSAVRQASWVFAVSQVLALLVPLLLIFVKTVAYVVIAIVAIVALVLLFSEREHS